MSVDKLNKWNKWIETIAGEVTRLSIKRHIFRETQKIIENNEKIQKPSAFYSFIGTSYRDSSVMAVRRQIKNDNDSISFAKLLREIIKEPQVVSRKQFVSLYTHVPHLANSDFDQFSKEGGDYIDPDMVRQDLDNLRDLSSKLEDLADRRIAHYDKRPPKELPTFNELDDCIDYLEKLLKKYTLVFKASAPLAVLPTLPPDWKEIFKVPWV